jgi:hypothetical protein
MKPPFPFAHPIPKPVDIPERTKRTFTLPNLSIDSLFPLSENKIIHFFYGPLEAIPF